jgi:hypothetical protein
VKVFIQFLFFLLLYLFFSLIVFFSCDHLRVTEEGHLEVYILATDPTGEVHSIRPVLHRKEELASESVNISRYYKTTGWTALKFWPPTVLELCQVKLTKAFRKRYTTFEEEIIWSLDQSVDAIKRINFAEEGVGTLFNIYFTINISMGSKSWNINKPLDAIITLNEFIRVQNTNATENLQNFKRVNHQNKWKNYVELHRYILGLENVFRAFMQHCLVLNQNAVDAVCSFLEVKFLLFLVVFFFNLYFISNI